MALHLSLPDNIEEGEENPWLKEGITQDDIEIAEHLGILTPKDVSDFDHMIEKEDKFREDGDDFFDENDNRGILHECEFINPNKVYENVQVRITIVKDNFAIGSIDGDSNVYISKSLIVTNNLTIGSIHMMDLVYKPNNKNTWKAIYVHQKVSPVLYNEFSCNGIDYKTFHVPKQDVGKMIGRGGICIQKVLNDIVYNNEAMKDAFNGGIESDTLIIDGAGIPKLDIENHEDYTEIKVWDNPEKRNLAPGSFDVVNDLVKKIYY